MKKSHVVMLGLLALTAGAVHAAPTSTKAAAQEAAFEAQLSEAKRELFDLMDDSQREAVLSAASECSADEAVDRVIQNQKLTLVDGELVADAN